jgi:hypothetical protein
VVPVTGASAQSYPVYQRCAVGAHVVNSHAYADLIRMYGSVNSQPDVELDASVCTQLINENGWFAMSKYGEWERRNGGLYHPVCGVTWSWGDSVTVYTRTGDEYLGWLDCNHSFPDSQVSDLSSLY